MTSCVVVACGWAVSKVMRNSLGPLPPLYTVCRSDSSAVDMLEVKKNRHVPLGTINVVCHFSSCSSIYHGCQLSNSQCMNTGEEISTFSNINLLKVELTFVFSIILSADNMRILFLFSSFDAFFLIFFLIDLISFSDCKSSRVSFLIFFFLLILILLKLKGVEIETWLTVSD